MRRHEFGASFAGELCGQPVILNGIPTICSRHADNEIHEPRYDADSQFWLPEADPWPGDTVPTRAYYCRDCGSVVVDQAFHDLFHETLEKN